ncbi:MAG: hypothetical protein KGZ81_06690 [Flavobacteriales bacterium]|nr:hypothetical protein [Flavobacteriales bacterium]
MKKINSTSLLQPFAHFTDGFLLSFSVFFTLLFSLLAVIFKARFDGVLDTHFVTNITWFEPLLDNIINTISLTILLWLLAKWNQAKARLQDLLVTSLWSRMVFYPLILFNWNDWMRITSEEMVAQVIQNPQALPEISIPILGVLLIFGLLALASLAIFGWYLWHGFTVSTNQKSWKIGLQLVVAVLLAEVISKIVIHFIA